MKKPSKITRKRKWSWVDNDKHQTIKAHGPFELELKLSHVFKPGYVMGLDVVAFAPPGLHIPEEHIDPLIALGSVKTYLRKEIPQLDFKPTEEEPGKELKLLNEIIEQWDENNNSNSLLNKNFKLYASSYRSFIKGQSIGVRNALKKNNVEECQLNLKDIISRVKWNWRHYRKWWCKVEDKLVGNENLEVYKKIDQYISDQYSLIMLRSLESLETSKYLKSLLEEKNIFFSELQEENNFRKKRVYPEFLEEPEESVSHEKKMQHLYSHSLIKKHVDSSLFFFQDTIDSNSDSAWFAVIAAFFAMTLYLVPLVTVQWFFNLEINTGVWVFAATLLYILKDRTKEMIRKKLQNVKKSNLAHRKIRLRDGEDTIIGDSSEYLRYPNISDMKEDVITKRYASQIGIIQKSTSNLEQVQYYSKRLKIKEGLSRSALDVTEIIRFDLHSWLQKADAAKVKYSIYSNDEQKVASSKIERAYHFHFLIKITEREKSKSSLLQDKQEWKHFEVIANRDGILRLTQVLT
jgi:hypothetical protein